MRFDKNAMLLYAITDRAWIGKQTLYEQVEAALIGGATCVQLREKQLDAGNFYKEALEIKQLCKNYHVPFLINDNVDLAIEVGADGVHVGQADMPVSEVRAKIGEDRILGVSAQTVEQARAAEHDGADYLGVGAVFKTTTKEDAFTISHEQLQKICKAVKIPVVAIGGITKDNLMELKGSGVAGVSIVSAIFGATDIKASCIELLKRSKEMVCYED